VILCIADMIDNGWTVYIRHGGLFRIVTLNVLDNLGGFHSICTLYGWTDPLAFLYLSISLPFRCSRLKFAINSELDVRDGFGIFSLSTIKILLKH